MLARILPLLLIVFSAKIQAIEFPLEVIEFIDNARVVAFIEEADIDNSSYWEPFEGAPPLSMTDALNAIHEHLAADPDLGNATLAGIELKQIPHHENCWHYLVKIQTRSNAKPRSRYFIVLMSGKVISGLREPETVK
jgi:hypothetical protein